MFYKALPVFCVWFYHIRGTTFGNDDFMKKEVILEGMPARSVPESNPCFITTDPGLRLSRMTATTKDEEKTFRHGFF